MHSLRLRLLGTVLTSTLLAAAILATPTQAQVVGGDGAYPSGIGGGPFGGGAPLGAGNGGTGSPGLYGGGGGGGGGAGSGGGGAQYTYTAGSNGGGGGGGTGVTTGGNFTATVNITGGNGGAGGSAADSAAGSGAGGGGNGLAVIGSGTIGVQSGLTLLGGSGGIGGTNSSSANTGGGGGGGGYGLFATAPLVLTNAGTIQGGTGGAGGAGFLTTSGGGGGGTYMSGGGTITNTGTIAGGIGGSGASTAPGPGGVGITGAGLTIFNQGGTITGGLGGDGVTQARAIVLTGGTNSVGTGGTINGGIDVRGGTFMPAAPGSTAGTPLAINGPLTFFGGTQFIVRLTPSANDSVVVNGTATLPGATVVVRAGNGTYAVGTRQILEATTRTGTFDGVTSNLAFLSPTLSYDATHAYLTISAGTTDAVPDYRPAAVTRNQFAVASGLTNAGIRNGGTGPILTAFNQLTVAQAMAAFDSVSGEGITGAQAIAHRSSELFTAAMFDMTTFYGIGANDAGGTGNSITLSDPTPGFLAYAPTRAAPVHELADLPSAGSPVAPPERNRTWRAWGAGFGGLGDVRGNGSTGSSALNESIYGGALGVDYQVTPDYLVGVAVGGSDGTFSVPGVATTGWSTGGHVGVYDLANFGQFYGASSTAFSYFSNRTTRAIAGFGGLAGETERGDFASHEIRSRLEFGRHLDVQGASLTPFVALELAELRSNGFAESTLSGPGLLRLDLSGQSTASVPAYVGARFQHLTTLGNGMKISPTLEVSYIHEFAPQRTDLGAFAGLPNSAFLVEGARPAYDSVRVKAGGELALNTHAVLFGNFVGDLSGVSQFYAGKGGFRYVW